MFVRNIKVSNFKSFDQLDVDLGALNVLIGANASGKSNFVSILKFLKDIVDSGLDNAISMQGRVDYIRNLGIGSERDLSVALHLDSGPEPVSLFRVDTDGKRLHIFARQLLYSFAIEFYKVKKTYKQIVNELLWTDCEVGELGKAHELRPIGKCEVTLGREKGAVTFDLRKSEDVPVEIGDLLPPFFSSKFLEERLSPRELMLENPFFGAFLPPLFFVLSEFFSDTAIYDFDPKLSKRGTLVRGKAELEPDGSNLALVINSVLEDRKARTTFYNLVRDLLPFIEDITVEKLPDKSLLARVREVYSGERFLPASVISEGTINAVALITALYFDSKPLVVIEEPERSLHPYLISKVIDMMRDVSERLGKQVIVTTHNPEVVRYAGIDNILLVHRDEEGFSKISRPAEMEEVGVFLEKEMGVEELFVENLLG